MTTPDTTHPDLTAAETAADPLAAVVERPRVVHSLMVRQRIRETTEQVHGVVVQRVKDAHSSYDLATWHGLATEVGALARARKAVRTQAGDVRAACISVAASAILLAEQVDRPAEPKRGTKRASTERWRPTTFAVPEC